MGTDTSANLVWPTVPGRTYRVEYRERLDAGEWVALGTNMTATATHLMFTDSPVGIPQRFYRIVLAEGLGASSP